VTFPGSCLEDGLFCLAHEDDGEGLPRGDLPIHLFFLLPLHLLSKPPPLSHNLQFKALTPRY
jgi:hypothetical protein